MPVEFNPAPIEDRDDAVAMITEGDDFKNERDLAFMDRVSLMQESEDLDLLDELNPDGNSESLDGGSGVDVESQDVTNS